MCLLCNAFRFAPSAPSAPWSARRAFVLASAAAAAAPALAQTAPDIATLVRQVVQAAQPGDHIVCMSNGGFGGVHAKLLEELSKQ